jgi:hypothetical protein
MQQKHAYVDHSTTNRSEPEPKTDDPRPLPCMPIEHRQEVNHDASTDRTPIHGSD